MSYDIFFKDKKGKTIAFKEPKDIRGGTYQMGGTTEAWLNITYNYSKHFYGFWKDGIRSLYGKTAIEVIEEIEKVLPKLKDDISNDYWEATDGNVKKSLKNLLELAKSCPKSSIMDGD